MYWHITFRTKEGFVVFTDKSQLLKGVAALARLASPNTLLWCIVDTHVHVVVHCDRPEAGRKARGAAQAINHRMANGNLGPASIHKVNDAHHLNNIVDYVLRQTNKHKLVGHHPAQWPGSCFQDLVGARMIWPASKIELQQALPRMPESKLWRAVGLNPLCPATDNDLDNNGIPAIIHGAAAALALPDLSGNHLAALNGRTGAVHLARHLEYAARQIARAMNITPRAVHRLAARPVNPSLERAIRLQISIERKLRST